MLLIDKKKLNKNGEWLLKRIPEIWLLLEHSYLDIPQTICTRDKDVMFTVSCFVVSTDVV